VDTFHDNGGGANQQYRLYLDNAHPNPTTAPYWAAGTGANSASFTDPYYSFLGSQAAPAGQAAFSATQGGATPAGIIGFAWHTMTITQDGFNLTWAIDGNTITTVPDSALTLGGSQISLNAIDSGLSGNSTANGQLLNADIWDNLSVTATPEPSTIALGVLGLAGLFFARRRTIK
jgi:MYXO-CTERM domain-containing protein